MKESKTKIMKGSKNRTRLTQVKLYFLHINKQGTSMGYDNQEIHDNSVPGCFVLFEYRIDIKCKIN